MAIIPKSERLLNIVSFLLKARRPVSLAEIKDAVEGYRDDDAADASLDRRFERDKAALRELGVPLVYVGEGDPSGPGYVIPREEYFLPRLQLTPSETALLRAVGQFAMTGAAGPVSDALRSAVRKLRFDAAGREDLHGTDEERFLFQRRKPGATPDASPLAGELTAAALGRRAVTFEYYSVTSDTVARRRVAPYGVGFSNGHWYTVGRDLDRRAIRVFRMDRIRGEIKRLRPDATREEFEIPADFRVQDYVGLPPWLFGQAEPILVRIRLDADVAFMARMRPAPGDVWETHADGAATVTRQATNVESLVGWVLGFGRHAQALEPPDFARRVQDALRALAQAHRGKPGEANA